MTPSFSTMTPYDLVVLRVEFLSDIVHNKRFFGQYFKGRGVYCTLVA
jgi:hypothetical protein